MNPIKKYQYLTKILAIVILLFFTKAVKAQDFKLHSKFIIKNARINNSNITEEWINGDSFMGLYTVDTGDDIYFAVINPGKKSSSTGRVTNLRDQRLENSPSGDEKQLFTFQWSYANSYDDKKGVASVKIIQTRSQYGVSFDCTIVPENKDIISFSGMMNSQGKE
ncbi:MAG: hypothetical protein EOO47_23845 [Flavobacterium sp.]|nr:MAG: hypothetical protein EOO47_23845 [Flavobacterium sp.]